VNSKKCFRCTVALGLVACTCVLSFNHPNIIYNPNLTDTEKENIPQIPETFPSIVQSIGATGSSAVSTIEYKTNPAADSSFYDLDLDRSLPLEIVYPKS